jgi:hypothetical protein
MAIEIVFEAFSDADSSESLPYPKLYKVIRQDGEEINRTLADFSDATEEEASAYILEFKSFISSLVSEIPEVKALSIEAERTVKTISLAISYLRGALPTEQPEEQPEEQVE